MIYQRGNIWWFQFEHNGRRIQKSTGVSNRREAEKIYAAAKTAVHMGRMGLLEREGAPTLEEFGERFLNEIRVCCADHPATIGFYEDKWSTLMKHPAFARCELDKFNPALIAKFVSHKIEAGYARASVNRYLATLRRALRLAQEWEIVDRIPRIKLLSGERKRDYVLSYEDQEPYLAACPDYLHNFSEFALETGLRRKEMVTLLWSDIQWHPTGKAERGYIHVRGTKSGFSERKLTLTQRAEEVLERQKNGDKRVFTYTPSTYDHSHLRVRKKLGMSDDFVIHSLRHTFATRLGESGADAFTIRDLLGHSSITISQRYVHPTAGAKERAMLVMESLQPESESKESLQKPLQFPKRLA